MKVLVSAFACLPNRGSEPGLGWRWAIEIANRGHETWVLTCRANKPAIEVVRKDMADFDRLHFVYYDLPRWASWWRASHRGLRIYYMLWQWGAARLAKSLNRKLKFDVVHHVTFVSARFPSFMGQLGIPFVFGPIGGGDSAPFALRVGYSPRNWIFDVVRDISNAVIRFDPNMRRAFRQARLIYVVTPATRSLVPKCYRDKVRIDAGIGVEPVETPSCRIQANPTQNSNLKVLYVGRLICWKGMHLGLQAFAECVRNFPNAELTIVGSGPDKKFLQRFADKLGISDNVKWVEWVEHSEINVLYSNHDVFLFPSLHDSAPWVIMEALAHALPVVCLDLGGPGRMVDETCGRVIATQGRPRQRVIADLADALVGLADSPDLRRQLAAGALANAHRNAWQKVVARIYPIIEEL